MRGRKQLLQLLRTGVGGIQVRPMSRLEQDRCGCSKPYPNVVALGVILLHPFQGVDTMLVTVDFTGSTGSMGFGASVYGSQGWYRFVDC